MSCYPPQFRTRSFSLFATGVIVLLLSIALVHSFAAPPVVGSSSPSPNALAFFLPTLLGGLLTFVAAIRISLFARPWNLVLGGSVLFFVSWFAPLAMSAASGLGNLTWTASALFTLMLFRILGLIFSTTGAVRLLRKEPTVE